MPRSTRRQKTSESTRKGKERDSLSQRVELHGVVMLPCSYCAQNDLNCIGSDDSSRCSNCISAKRKCDLAPFTPKQWEDLEKEERRLQQQEEEAMAKILRLRRQQRRLKTKAKDMLRRGLKTMDELDEVKERERLEALPAQNQSQPQQSTDYDPSDFSKFAAPGEGTVRVPQSWAWLGGGDENQPPFPDNPDSEQAPMNC
jgi:hypothetical protein